MLSQLEKACLLNNAALHKPPREALRLFAQALTTLQADTSGD